MNQAFLIVGLTQSKLVEHVLRDKCKIIAIKSNICEGNETWLLEGVPGTDLIPHDGDLPPLINLGFSSRIIEGSRLKLNVWFLHAPLLGWEYIYSSPQDYLNELARLTQGTGRASTT